MRTRGALKSFEKFLIYILFCYDFESIYANWDGSLGALTLLFIASLLIMDGS